jgi:hypothetical protein
MMTKYRRLVTSLAVCVLVAAFSITGATSAGAATCSGQIRQGFISPAPAFPLSYHLSRNIDGDASDAEFVFVFSKPWRDGIDYLRWTASDQVKKVADENWRGTLGAKSCYGGGKFEVYADALAVGISGGPGHWASTLVVTTERP